MNNWRFAALVVMFVCARSASAENVAPLQLSVDSPLVIPLSKGDQRTVMLDLPHGDWLLEADEDFADVVISVDKTDGVNVAILDGIDEGYSEIRYLITPQNLPLILSIDTRNISARDATLVMRVTDAGAMLTDAHQAAALRLETALSQLPRNQTNDQRKAAREQSIAAAEQWMTAGNLERAGINLYYAAFFTNRLNRTEDARDLALQATKVLDETNNTKWHGFALSLAGLTSVLLRDFDRSETYLNQSATLLSPMFNERNVNPAQSILCFGLLRQRKPDEAEPCYKKILPIAQRAGNTSSVGRFSNNMAGIYNQRGDYSGAMTAFESALEDISDSDNIRWQARLHNNLGFLQNRLGYTQRAITNYQKALDASGKLGDKEQSANFLSNLGAVYSKLGIPKRSVSMLREASELLEDARPELLGITKRQLAGALAQVGEFESAKVLLGEVSAIAQTTRDSLTLDLIEIEFAKIEISQGQVDAAEVRLKSVIARRDATADQRLRGIALLLHARALLAQDKWRDALFAAEAGHQIFTKQKSHLEQAEALALMGWSSWQLGERRNAQIQAQEAIALIESLRRNIASADLRASYQSAAVAASELLIHSFMDLDEQPDQALQAAEAFRARTLVDVLSKSRDAPVENIPSELIRRREVLRIEINDAESERIRGGDSVDIHQLAVELDALEGEIGTFDPRYRAATDANALTVDAMQALLGENDVVVQFYLGERYSYRWLITKHTISAAPVQTAGLINAMARQAHSALSQRADVTSVSRQLGNALLSGTEDAFAQAQNIIVVADRGLHYVPFEILTTDKSPRPVLMGRHLSYAPSLTTIALNRESPGRPSGAITILADPVFNESDLRTRSDSNETVKRSAADIGTLNRLIMSAEEAESIQSLAADYEVNLFTGFAANADVLSTKAISDASVIHIATHGFVDDEIPESNGLALSIRNLQGDSRSGYVSLRDIYELRLNADLVVLSACDTALGRDMAGEGLLGLTRGFMYAGAHRVIASLWQVEDRATAKLMAHFYEALLRDKLAPPEALAYAKSQMQANRRWRHPYFWSGFVLSGDWAPLQ